MRTYCIIFGAAPCNKKKMISPDPMTMNPSSARPSFNGAADGESFTSSISNGTSGRSTPTFVLGGSSSTSFELVPAEQLASSSSRAKPKNGREKGALAYSATEHQALLALLQATPTAFNGGESAPEWKEGRYQKMVDGFYRDLGVAPRQSITLYGHFVELYSAFNRVATRDRLHRSDRAGRPRSRSIAQTGRPGL